MEDRVRTIVLKNVSFRVTEAEIGPISDLWAAGMSSMQSVSVLIAIENEFDIELPEESLTRSTFGSISALARAVESCLAAEAV